MAATPVALDHNFPEPILDAVLRWLPEIYFHWIRKLPGSLNELDDHDLIYELSKRRFPVMVTNNHRMLDDPRVLVAIEQTRLTVVGLRKAGDDPIFATGVLLRDLQTIIQEGIPEGVCYRISPARVRPTSAREQMARRGLDPQEAIRALGRNFADRTPYPEGHHLLIR